MKKIKLIMIIVGLVYYSDLCAINVGIEKQVDYQIECVLELNGVDVFVDNTKSFPIEMLYPLMPDSNQVVSIKKKKFIAITLAVTLGVFGVHRLYLGTSTKVPIIYTLTLGGGFGVLVVSDIIAIIMTKDLNKYSPNANAFMWAE
jgi:TM2 domain-containing membrane protein YozV